MSEKKDNVWILTFEYAGVAKFGGLAEVPANQAKNLANMFNITAFLPSHGEVEKLKNQTSVERLPFNAEGEIDPSRIGLKDSRQIFKIAYYKINLNGVNIVLLSGDNEFTKKYLDDPIIYSPDTFNGKLCLYSIGMKFYVKYLLDQHKSEIPAIVHMHDYHVVFSFIGIKQELYKNKLDVPAIITIHLLTWPRFDFTFYEECGINDDLLTVLLKNGIYLMHLRDIFAYCQEKQNPGDKFLPPSVEKIGAFVSDLVTTVSNSYLKSDIIPNLGRDLIEFKTDFIHDGCDWDYKEILNEVNKLLGNEIRELFGTPEGSEITKEQMKKYLLTYKIAHLNQDSLINSKKILEALNEISNGHSFGKNGNITAFSESGPLMIATGRISPQKGFETIFAAIPDVIKAMPNAKFLLLILPTEYSIKEIGIYAEYVKKFPDNLRILFGLASDILYLAHLSADVYCALSRWEPFGIIALEAMAAKVPVIATRIGGLQESIIDIRSDPVNGTGMFIDVDNSAQFANALITLFKLAEISERVKKTGSIYETNTLLLVNQIPDGVIKSRVLLDPSFYTKLRENCAKRVNTTFKWSIVSKKLVSLFARVKESHPTAWA